MTADAPGERRCVCEPRHWGGFRHRVGSAGRRAGIPGLGQRSHCEQRGNRTLWSRAQPPQARVVTPRGQGWGLGPVSPQPQAAHQTLAVTGWISNAAWLVLWGGALPCPIGPVLLTVPQPRRWMFQTFLWPLNLDLSASPANAMVQKGLRSTLSSIAQGLKAKV